MNIMVIHSNIDNNTISIIFCDISPLYDIDVKNMECINIIK